MNKFLQKIAWKTRRWNLKFSLFDLYLHDGDGCWGFTFFEIIKDYRPYSFLAIEFRLPNGAEVKELTVNNWDFLFLSTPLWDWISNLEDRKLWGSKLTSSEKFWLNLLHKLY